ncbi:MAG: DUF6932 family protein [bacterium]
MIPKLVSIGAIWRVLPPGIHEATLDDVAYSFATNARRKILYDGLVKGCQALKVAGCSTVYLDGSYITEKLYPRDFDVCWDPTGVNPAKLDPVLLDFSNKRRNQKMKYGGEFFPSSAKADGSRTFIDFFQTDRESGNEKGIIRIRL